jgi:CRISPR system Cascade subunit CasE
MYLSKIILDRRLVPLEELATLFAQGHTGHALAWQVFSRSESQTRDFIFREEWERDRFTLWTVSQQEPGDWNGYLSVESKPYNPRLSVGQKLRFTMRANATIAAKQPGEKRGKRHDIIMHAKQQLTPDERRRYDTQELIQQVGFDWLERQGERRGFSPMGGAVLVDGYQQHAFRKKPSKKSRVQFSTLDFEGILTVNDPDLFLEALQNGIGSTRAYGNGLMLIRSL